MATSGLMKHPISVSIKPAAAHMDEHILATAVRLDEAITVPVAT
jgi:hypothetical protein